MGKKPIFSCICALHTAHGTLWELKEPIQQTMQPLWEVTAW
jgi:hypothetical protein